MRVICTRDSEYQCCGACLFKAKTANKTISLKKLFYISALRSSTRPSATTFSLSATAMAHGARNFFQPSGN